MIGGIGGANKFGFLRVGSAVGRSEEVSGVERQTRVRQLQDLYDRAAAARAEFVDLVEQLRGSVDTSGTRTLVSAQSSSELELGLEDRAAELESSEEINAITTSYTPAGPDWAGTSSSLVTVDGAYTGTTDDTLTFKATGNRTVGGPLDIELEVYDSQDNLLETVVFTAGMSADTPVALSNGLEISLGEGNLKKNDTFTVSVSASTPSAVDPDKSFDGTRNDRPGFEPGVTVTAGQFEVNGTTIDVYATDTLQNVVDRIHSSSAGVDAEFDAATETIRLTQREVGAENSIVLSNDTSGFLAATKLDTGTLVEGSRDEYTALLENSSRYDNVQAGSFSVNGVSITVDPTSDTLEDVLARIDASAAGVSAEYDQDSDRVLIRSLVRGQDLVLDDQSSGFLEALSIESQSIAAREAGANRLGDLQRGWITEAAGALSQMFYGVFHAVEDEVAGIGEGVRQAVGRALRVHLDRSSAETSRDRLHALGLQFEFDESGAATFRIDAERFEEAARHDPDRLARFLLEDEHGEARDGILLSLLHELEQTEHAVADSLGSVGVLVDVHA